MDTNGKRKHDGEDGGASRGGVKRSKGGNQGKWMTPSHKAKVAALKGRSLEIGDMGFWVTCQRHKEMRAADEIISLCDEYGQKLFGIKTDGATASEEEGDDIEDIDAAIERDLEALKQANKKPGEDAPFELLKVNVDCVLFMRTRAPVDPLLLVREICKGAAATAGDRGRWRARFVNKLTPVSLTGKATEKGLVELARKVLADHFELAEGEGEGEEEEQDKEGNGEEEACSYAIRPTIRAHTTLKRLDVIEKIASMISKKHKVDLKNPDKVIIIEIFQTFCGMSVVGKDWDAMKKYNLYELYTAKSKSGADAEGSKKVVENEEEKPEGGGESKSQPEPTD
ncbi:hypothetical protein GGR50DRAFT_534270 [Xylaria sp. CBS 124048]|nr:hypothetical protein GGR50DRAFT_534270 [Xylaria sp. CBS 124048]